MKMWMDLWATFKLDKETMDNGFVLAGKRKKAAKHDRRIGEVGTCGIWWDCRTDSTHTQHFAAVTQFCRIIAQLCDVPMPKMPKIVFCCSCCCCSSSSSSFSCGCCTVAMTCRSGEAAIVAIAWFRILIPIGSRWIRSGVPIKLLFSAEY